MVACPIMANRPPSEEPADLPGKELEPTDGPSHTINETRWTASPEIVELGSQVVDVIKKLANSIVEAKRTTRGATYWSIVLAALVIITVGILAWTDKLSSEGTAFLLGAIITGTIAIVRDFTGNR